MQENNEKKTMFRQNSDKVNKIGRNIILSRNMGTRLHLATVNSSVDDRLVRLFVLHIIIP